VGGLVADEFAAGRLLPASDGLVGAGLLDQRTEFGGSLGDLFLLADVVGSVGREQPRSHPIHDPTVAHLFE
jgi:hypothetical protein